MEGLYFRFTDSINYSPLQGIRDALVCHYTPNHSQLDLVHNENYELDLYYAFLKQVKLNGVFHQRMKLIADVVKKRMTNTPLTVQSELADGARRKGLTRMILLKGWFFGIKDFKNFNESCFAIFFSGQYFLT